MLIQLQNYLTLENIYFWSNFGVIPFWLLLIIVPNSKITGILVNSILVPLILSSLYDCSLQGCNIPTLIREVDKKDIPQIKSGLKEPTFEYIKSLFNFKNN